MELILVPLQVAQFDIGIAPDTANSSVAFTKGYLVKFTGSVETVTVTLNNAAGDASELNYEVTMDAKPQ